MLKGLIKKVKDALNNLKLWYLYQNYAQKAHKNIQKEITETLDQAFEENREVMNVFKERLVRLYNDDKHS
jgi:hypothetical protein